LDYRWRDGREPQASQAQAHPQVTPNQRWQTAPSTRWGLLFAGVLLVLFAPRTPVLAMRMLVGI